MYSAIDIAQYFLDRAKEENRPVSNLKLQKLVYLAHGFYLVITGGQPLLIEPIEAWSYGPVINELYHKYKQFGSGIILNRNQPTTFIELSNIPDNLELNNFQKNVEFNENAKKALDFTWQTCRDLSAIQLSNWTHKEESPWKVAINEGKSTISNSEIMKYFERFKAKEKAKAKAE